MAYITNLGKYNEGQLVGKWHPFPTTPEALQQTMKEIGIDGIRYEEYFITDYETNISGLYDALGEYENLDELNYLAEVLEGLDDGEIVMLEGAIEYGGYSDSAGAIINLAQNLDHFYFLPGITDEKSYGEEMADAGAIEIPEHLERYFDYEAYGSDISTDGVFTKQGYIEPDNGKHTEYYSGLEDIPDESRVFSRPGPERPQGRDVPDKGEPDIER